MTFEEWLKQNHYRDSTLRVTLRDVERAKQAWQLGRELPPATKPAVQRYVTYAKRNGEDVPLGFIEWAEAAGAGAVSRLPTAKPKRRKFEAVSMPPESWNKLKAALRKGRDIEDRVLYLITMSGLRVGDVLRTPRVEIARGLKSGVLNIERKGGTFIAVPIQGLEDAWRVVLEAMDKAHAKNVAGVVCRENDSPLAGDCAYKRLDRRLKEVGEAVGLEGRAHLHRLRRTMAVRGLEATNRDIIAVQQLLGHANVTSTQKYLDELRVDDVAKTRNLIHGVKK